MAKLKIDGKEIEVPDHFTLLQACEEAGAEVPRFCFHERLSVAGNCRMCLVEVKGGPPKPAASCAMGVRDIRGGPNGELPEVFTNTPMVKKAREGVMEFLLINHPLDCPICDQGGECDLQDQAMAFGIDSSRYTENKRAVEDKYIGPLVKTVMNRCIHCTRCVRFTTEVAGIAELGLIGRGEDAEITTYLEQAMTSELQGNVVDLCPVGALTSKPFAFTARPWELNKTESIDVMDALGSAIRVDTRGREVMRIMPRVNEQINEEWISDKSRFVWDGLKTQRLDRPYVKKDGRLQPASWAEAFAAIKTAVASTSADKIGAVAGDLASVEEIFALKSLVNALGSSNTDCRQDGTALDPSLGRSTYLFNAGIEGIEAADAILIVGANPRYEAAVLNARIRKRWRRGGLPIGVIGEGGELRYPYEYLGAGTETLADLVSGKNSFAETLKAAKNPLIIIGQGALIGAEGKAVLANAAKLAADVGAFSDEWNGFAVLHTAAAASARSTSASCRAKVPSLPVRCCPRSTSSSCSAPTNSTFPPRPPSAWSISAATATTARTMPTSSCRARPTPRSRAPGSTPKAASRWATAPASRRARPAKTGRSCVHCPTCSARSCRLIRCRSCVPSFMKPIRILPRSTRSHRALRPILLHWRKNPGRWASLCLRRRSKTSI